MEEVEGYRDDDMMLMMNKNEANERTSEWSWDEIIVLIWKTALHSTFFVLPLFCLSFYYSYEAYGPIAPSNAYTTESEWCENFLDMPTNKQASCLLTTFALARAVEKATTATTTLGKVLIKLYDEMMEISRVVKSRLATVKTQICEYP